MRINTSNKVRPEFSMSSMTDIVFLLLVFFMITSNSIKGLDLQLPKSKSAPTLQEQSVFVSISNDKEGFYINDNLVPEGFLEDILVKTMKEENKDSFILKAQYDIPIQRIVNVMDIANRYRYKVVLAVRSNKAQ